MYICEEQFNFLIMDESLSLIDVLKDKVIDTDDLVDVSESEIKEHLNFCVGFMVDLLNERQP